MKFESKQFYNNIKKKKIYFIFLQVFILSKWDFIIISLYTWLESSERKISTPALQRLLLVEEFYMEIKIIN